jgi:hypothetical protein
MLLMAGGVVILESGRMMMMMMMIMVMVGFTPLVDIIRCKFIFRSATLSPPYKHSRSILSLFHTEKSSLAPKRHFQSPSIKCHSSERTSQLCLGPGRRCCLPIDRPWARPSPIA